MTRFHRAIDDEEFDDDLRELTIDDWGPMPGRVIGVLRAHLGFDMAKIKELRATQRSVIVRGGIRDLHALMCAIEEAGAKVGLRYISSALEE